MNEEDYAVFNHTQGCMGCAWLQDKVGPKRPHSKECRGRMLKELEALKQELELLRREMAVVRRATPAAPTASPARTP